MDAVLSAFEAQGLRIRQVECRFKINRLKEALQQKAQLLYMVDRREVHRETF